MNGSNIKINAASSVSGGNGVHVTNGGKITFTRTDNKLHFENNGNVNNGIALESDSTANIEGVTGSYHDN